MHPSRPHAPQRRTLMVVGGVIVLHVGALWALQSGLVRRAVELIVPVELISQVIEPPKPQVQPPPPPPPPPRQAPRPVAQQVQPTLPPAPQPLAITDPAPAPNAPVVAAAPPAPLAPITAPVAASIAVAPAPAPAAPPAPPPRIELPVSDAAYLNNPQPAYPAISRRMGEQGKVIVRAYIGTDGTAQRAEVRQSSGSARLDDAAVQTVLRWRYVPGKRGGVPEAMWFNIPINFVLE